MLFLTEQEHAGHTDVTIQAAESRPADVAVTRRHPFHARLRIPRRTRQKNRRALFPVRLLRIPRGGRRRVKRKFSHLPPTHQKIFVSTRSGPLYRQRPRTVDTQAIRFNDRDTTELSRGQTTTDPGSRTPLVRSGFGFCFFKYTLQGHFLSLILVAAHVFHPSN